MSGAPDPDIAKFYGSPESKRVMARAMAAVSALLLVWLVVSTARDWQVRSEKGIPLNYGAIVMCVAPLMLFFVGLWIGWGHTRVDFGRRIVQQRPFGLPWPASGRPLSDASCLYVGFHRGPWGVQTASASMQHEVRAYWYVQLQGPDLLIPLVVQRERKEEALAFAEHIGDACGLPVVVTPERT
jgi:hypothetical protein